MIEFAEQAVPVWDPFPDAGDFLWGATVIVAQSADGGLLGFLSDAPPKVAMHGEVVSPEELAAAGELATAVAPAAAAAEEEVDWSVGTAAKPKAATPAGPPVLPSGAMWDKVVRFGGHPVPVVDPMRFAHREKPETRPDP